MTSESINTTVDNYLPEFTVLEGLSSINGYITGPDPTYLDAADFSATYDFLASASVMIGATTITSPERYFTFYIPEQNIYQTSPN